MNKLQVSPEAARDLERIHLYIAHELHNRKAAGRITKEIIKTMRILQRYALAGVSLEEKLGYQTDLRMLVSEGYCIFYHAAGNIVSVARVISGRQDYIAELFGGMAFSDPNS